VFYYQISSGAKTPTVLIADAHNGGLRPVPGSEFVVFSKDSMNAPAEVWRFTLQAVKANDQRPLTFYNRDFLSQYWLSKPEIFYFNYPGTTDTIQGWLLKPFGFDASKKYPLAQLIHGGPEGAWLDSWSYRWNPQIFAAAGFVTIAINPHGSTGQGQAFTDAVRLDWGGLPFRDLMAGNDYIVNNNSYVDRNRMCALGASYGGFMINWINGNDARNRFKCLVNHDGLFSSIGMYYATEEVFFNEAEFGPPPYTSDAAHAAYDKFSPERFVQNWVTPTLVVHGGNDFRIPLSEGLSTFTALQRKNIPSKLLHYPLENHWVLNSLNSIQWHDVVLAWIKQWTA